MPHYSLQIADQDILQKLQQHGENNSATPFHFFDVGCGPGVLSFEFVHQYRNALKDIRITASDFSHGMVQHGKDSFKSDSTLSPFSDMSGTLQCDRMVLEEVANASVDIIGSNFGGSNRAIGYAAAYRILKKDGLLFITVWSDTCLQMVWLDKITGMFNSAQVGQDSMSYPSLSFGTDRDKCVKELGEAGFTDVKSYCTTCTILFNDLEQVMIELIEKESQQNVYSDVEAKMNITDPLPDGGPRLIPFTGFTVIARK
ncbi:hypothetical protein PHMEG_00019346 [Phytophthora megakarya]|uniref:Uncharacterized protein n=1 Tax=Phytophthora megakarya TaxID=4795 RepID=A0A225VTA4_9STRA|nr:hypothetical protein PHMEG_00019346 [Phytophthora megakarya]